MVSAKMLFILMHYIFLGSFLVLQPHVSNWVFVFTSFPHVIVGCGQCVARWRCHCMLHGGRLKQGESLFWCCLWFSDAPSVSYVAVINLNQPLPNCRASFDICITWMFWKWHFHATISADYLDPQPFDLYEWQDSQQIMKLSRRWNTRHTTVFKLEFCPEMPFIIQWRWTVVIISYKDHMKMNWTPNYGATPP